MTMDATSANRQIRVFISSTFLDMHGERDHLVKFVFPQLRRLCDERGVTWGEVDLRWGVTDEAAAEGKVLPICLEEINRCRPYFIGLLGERYGWVPQTIPDELLKKQEWLREQFGEHKSVTELEILHGVLRNPAMAGYAYFYFRDPDYVNSIPEEDRKNFVSEDADKKAKLGALKENILRSGLPVRENYRDPKALGELVLADLTAVIDRRWPEGSRPHPLKREELDHAAYARSRERVYIGRPEYFARLDAHTAGGGNQPLVIVGESGSGKSALLANWAAGYRKAHPEAFVLEHYIGATPSSADWAAMLWRTLGEFRKRLGLAQEIPHRPDELRSAFPNWLHMAATKGRIVLVLDALNQLEDRDGAPDLVWLPPVMPENVRLIVSTPPGRPMDEITKRGWPVFKVEPLTAEERKELIRKFLGEYGRTLSSARVERIALAPQAANPLYLRVLLDELRLFGRHEQLEERIGHYIQAASPHDLYGKVIARWDEDYGGGIGLVADTLSLLWAARRGLTESEILDALGGSGRPLPRAVWSPFFLAMVDALVSRSGLLAFGHDFLRTATREAYLPTESHRQQVHIRLGDYFEGRPSSPRRTDELPWQLAEAHAWQRLYDLLANRDFFKEAWRYDQLEVRTYWARIEAGSAQRMVEAYPEQIEHPEKEGDKDFLWCLSVLLGDTGHIEEALVVRSALVEYFKSTGDQANLQAGLGNQALILQARGDLDGAMAAHKEEERLCRELGDKEGLSRSLGNQALIVRSRGKLEEAMVLHKEEERLCRELGNKAGLSRSLGNQAVILYMWGKLDEAMALRKEEERLDRELGNLDGLQKSLGNQALILHIRGKLGEAMALHKEKERLCRELGNKAGLLLSLGNQALILRDLGKLDEAMELHKEEERLCRELGNKAGLSRSLGNQALILQKWGKLDEAMALHKEEERLCRELGYKAGLQFSLGGQADIFEARGDLDGAMALHKEEERLCRELGYKAPLAHCIGAQAAILWNFGKLEEATALLEDQERLCREAGDKAELSRSLGNQALLLRDRGELDRAMARLKEQERLCRELGRKDELLGSLSRQAEVLGKRGDLDGAMTVHKEQERVCRELGDIEGVALSLANQARILTQKPGGKPRGLALAEEAASLAAEHGFTALAERIRGIFDKARAAAH